MFKDKNHLTLPSKNFIRGNANLSDHPFGQGLIVDGGEKKSQLFWEFECFKRGTYHLLSSYATDDLRPVELYLNSRLIKKNALNQITGGWYSENIKHFLECDIELFPGKHLLELKTPSFIPHLQSFTLIPKNGGDPLKSFNRKNRLSKWLINPFQNQSPSPVQKIMHSFASEGIKNTLHKCLFHFNPFQFLKRNYADILGVYSKSSAFKGPDLVQIDITNSCNNNCIGCWCNSPLLEEKRMPDWQKAKRIPFERLADLLHELKAMGTRQIYYSGGGEPFTHPDILRILTLTKRLGFITYVNTNFTLVNPEILQTLCRIGLDHLTVSVWAGTVQTYRATHPNKNESDFMRLQQNLTYLNHIKNGPPYTKVYHVLSKINFHEFMEMFHFARNTSSDSVEYTLIDVMPGKTDSLLLDRRDLVELKKQALKLKNLYESSSEWKRQIVLFGYNDFMRRIDDVPNASSGFYDQGLVENIPCTIGWTFSRINADGEVNGCLKSHKIPVGNIFRQSFSDLWNSPAQKEFRRHTFAMTPLDPYLRQIGNDSRCDKGCRKTCDDIGRNLELAKKMKKLSTPFRLLLKGLGLSLGFFHTNRPSLQKNDFFASLHPSVKGYLDGHKAFKGPDLAVIDLTNHCHNSCICCFTYSSLLKESRPASEWARHSLPWDSLEKLLHDLSALRTERIRFSGGGDPLLYPSLRKALLLSKKLGFHTSVTSSLLAPRKVLDELLSFPPDELSVSLSGASFNSYQKVHPGIKPEEYDRILNTLSNFRKKTETKIVLCHVLFKENYQDLPSMIHEATSLDAHELHFSKLLPLHPELETLALDAAEKRHLRELISALSLPPNLVIHGLDVFQTRENAPSLCPAPCSIGWHFTRILASGDVIPCCNGIRAVIGNITQQSFSSIWNAKTYENFRNESLNPSEFFSTRFKCSHCDNLQHNQNFYHQFIKPFEDKK